MQRGDSLTGVNEWLPSAEGGDDEDMDRWPPLREALHSQQKRPHNEESDVESTSIRQHFNYPILTEDHPDYVQMTLDGKSVSMSKTDYWLNATEILKLAGKNEDQIKSTLN